MLYDADVKAGRRNHHGGFGGFGGDSIIAEDILKAMLPEQFTGRVKIIHIHADAHISPEAPALD